MYKRQVLVHAEAGAERLQVVALGTGTKCLTASAADADATGLRTRDGHAEVSARRAFRRFLCAELCALFDGEPSILERTGDGDAPFRVRRSTSVVFFSSASPCGDASLFAREEAPLADSNAGEAGAPAKRARHFGGATAAPAAEPAARAVAAEVELSDQARGEANAWHMDASLSATLCLLYTSPSPRD